MQFSDRASPSTTEEEEVLERESIFIPLKIAKRKRYKERG